MMFFIAFVIVNLFLAAIVRAYCKISCGFCMCSKHLVGKTAMVTGANSGIGFETAKDFAERGARVILACRSETRGTSARDLIIKQTSNSDVHFVKVDLASFTSIRAFADQILRTEKRLDILVNNAGVFDSGRLKTEDGLLFTMQVNHFGPFLLTNLLLPLLKSSAPSRIINVTSDAYRFADIDFMNMNAEKETEQSFSRFKVYSTSKLCNVLWTLELAKRLTKSRVSANCLHPGVVDTGLISDENTIVWRMLRLLFRLVMKSPREGAQTSIYLAVSPDVEGASGHLYRDCKETVLANKHAHNGNKSEKLWELSEKFVK